MPRRISSRVKMLTVQGTGRGGLQPVFYPLIGLASPRKLGKDVGIDQETVHRSSGLG